MIDVFMGCLFVLELKEEVGKIFVGLFLPPLVFRDWLHTTSPPNRA